MDSPRLPVPPVRPGDAPPRPSEQLQARREAVFNRGGISLGSPFGVPVRVSVLGLVIAGVLAASWFSGYAQTDSSSLSDGDVWKLTVLGGVALELSVLAHEIAHCVVARGMGLHVGGLRLMALGGVSMIEVEQRDPRREAAVALAGPAMTVLLATISSAAFLGQAHGSITRVDGSYDPFVLLLGFIALFNTGLAVFNLLPGLPLDGGRILRAAIWGATGRVTTGTRVAAYAGFVVAALAVAAAATGQTGLGLYTVFVAGYIALNARAALAQADIRERATEVQIGSLVRSALRVAADTPLAEAIRRAKDSQLRAMIIVDPDGSPTAIASDQAIQAVPEQRRPWVPVSSVSRPLISGLILDTRLGGQAALEAMNSQPSGEYLVVGADDTVLGVLAAADLAGALLPGQSA